MKTILKPILSRYQIGEPYTISELEDGHTCSIYKVETDNRQYLLRIRPDFFTEKEIESDHQFLTYLTDRGFPVPELNTTVEGSTYGLTDEKRLFELQSFLPHNKNVTNFNYQDISSQIARFLGQFHYLSKDYPEKLEKMAYVGKMPLGFYEKYFDGPLKYGVKRYRETLKSADGSIKTELDTNIDTLEKRLKEIRAVITKALPDIPQVVNHNDFYGNNILFQDNKIAGLVDFDFSSTGIYYIDLVELMHGSMIWNDDCMPFWGLDSEGKIRVKKGEKDLEIYFKNVGDLYFDQQIFKEFLIAKVISLAFYPAFDMVDTPEDRLEVTRRLLKTIDRLDNW